MKRALVILSWMLLAFSARAQTVPALPAEGSPHILTVLVEFRNVRFSVEDPAACFRTLTGKAADYYRENSDGRFCPVFDVVGPVLVDAPMADFGRDLFSSGVRLGDAAPEKALVEACRQLDGEVDFSQYDADADGTVDMVLFYYAGYDQAAGGPSDAIWSHHQDLRACPDASLATTVLDGVNLGWYFCTAELRGSEGTTPIGIGTTVHELGHALGLPDLYDTNGATDGMAGGPYQFSLMGKGMYNDDGDTPPWLNAMERMLLGWLDPGSIPVLEEGWHSLEAVQKGAAAISKTAVEGEYFLYEYRSGIGWDAPLPRGLVVYHVDRSERESGGLPARVLWDEWRSHNRINSLGSHPCFYLVPPMEPRNLNYSPSVNARTLVFPGAGDVRGFAPVDWKNAPTGIQISCIELGAERVSLRVWERSAPQMSGRVTDSGGAPVTDALVTLYLGDEVLDRDRTGMDGVYLLDLPDSPAEPLTVRVEKEGFRTVREPVAASGSVFCRYFTLYPQESPAAFTLIKYSPSNASGYFAVNEPLIGAVRFDPGDLAPYAGARLQSVVCHPFIQDTEAAGPMYLTVDVGSRRVLSLLVEDPPLGEYAPVEVPLEGEDIRIREGQTLYIGYGFPTPGSNLPLSTVYPGEEGNSFYAPFSLEESRWKPLYVNEGGFYMNLMLEARTEEVPAATLGEMGYPSISLPTGPYRAGQSLPCSLLVPEGADAPEAVQWFLDGAALSGPNPVPTAGEHTLEARLRYADGREERVFADFEVL